MPSNVPQAALAMAEQQYGVVTRRQLADAGVSRSTIRWAVGRHWRVLLPGVLFLDHALPTDRQRCMAAQLFAGPRSWLGGPTAAALHRLPGHVVEPPLHVLVPHGTKPRQVLWVIVRSTSITDERLVHDGPLRLSAKPRALVDAAATLPDDHARSSIIEAVHRRLVRIDDVAHWVQARENTGRPRLRAFVEEAAANAWSHPEAQLSALLRTSRILPPAWPNPELVGDDGRRLTTPDLWLDDVAVAIMVHSRQFHAGVLDWESTVEADGDLQLYGVIVVGVTPETITRDPSGVLRRVERIYEQAARLPRSVRVVVHRRPSRWAHTA